MVTTSTVRTITSGTRPAERAPRSPFRATQWLWCLHCERFFQGRSARPDRVGGTQGCAFADCDGAGYGVDLFDWDAWPGHVVERRAHWPAAAELTHGLRAPAWSRAGDDATPTWQQGIAEDGFERNRDAARRCELLGLPAAQGDDGDARAAFEGLDITMLALLIEERFVAPWDRYGRAPCVADVLQFLARFPEARATGEVVCERGEDEPDVAITGLSCVLDGLAPARADAVRLAFEIECFEGGTLVQRRRHVRASFESRAADEERVAPDRTQGQRGALSRER